MSFQSKIEKEKKELLGYSYICDKKDMETIEEGDYIKYYNETGVLKSGGIVIKNEYPEKIILKYPQKDIFWAVSLEKNNCIYLKKNCKELDELYDFKKAMQIYKKIKNKELFLIEKKV